MFHSLSSFPYRLLRWVRRFRHRCGYGIHSPFAFNFVTGVVYERGTYYAYPTLRSYFLKHRASTSLRLKDLLLLFRIANYQHPRCCWIAPTEGNELVRRFMEKGSSQTLYVRSPHPPAEANLLYIYKGWETRQVELMEALSLGGLLIVGRTEGASAQAWQSLQRHPQARVSFDLGDFGLVFFHPELQRQSYVINYF